MFQAVFLCFVTSFGYWACGGGGVSQGIGTQPDYAPFQLGQRKNGSFRKLFFFNIVTTQCDHPRYVKHVLGRIFVFFTLFGDWVWGGRVSQGIGTQPDYAVFQLGRYKNGSLPKLSFFNVVTTQYDHPRHVKDVLGRIFVVCYLIWLLGVCGGGGGVSQGIGTKPDYAVF